MVVFKTKWYNPVFDFSPYFNINRAINLNVILIVSFWQQWYIQLWGNPYIHSQETGGGGQSGVQYHAMLCK